MTQFMFYNSVQFIKYTFSQNTLSVHTCMPREITRSLLHTIWVLIRRRVTRHFIWLIVLGNTITFILNLKQKGDLGNNQLIHMIKKTWEISVNGSV